jgi:hypothetical protein
MKKFFQHPFDTKNLVIGVVASIVGVIIWDIIKEKKLWGKNETVEEAVEGGR